MEVFIFGIPLPREWRRGERPWVEGEKEEERDGAVDRDTTAEAGVRSPLVCEGGRSPKVRCLFSPLPSLAGTIRSNRDETEGFILRIRIRRVVVVVVDTEEEEAAHRIDDTDRREPVGTWKIFFFSLFFRIPLVLLGCMYRSTRRGVHKHTHTSPPFDHLFVIQIVSTYALEKGGNKSASDRSEEEVLR